MEAEEAQAEAGTATTSVSKVLKRLRQDLAAIPGAEIDYVEIVDEVTLTPLKKLSPGVNARALVALRFDSVRLIDNLSLTSRR